MYVSLQIQIGKFCCALRKRAIELGCVPLSNDGKQSDKDEIYEVLTSAFAMGLLFWGGSLETVCGNHLGLYPGL